VLRKGVSVCQLAKFDMGVVRRWRGRHWGLCCVNVYGVWRSDIGIFLCSASF